MALRSTEDLPDVTKSFILGALAAGCRVDGREALEPRQMSCTFSRSPTAATCELLIGTTRALAHVSGTLVPPYPDRPTEGQLSFGVEFSPMGAPEWEAGRPPAEAVELARIIERSIRDSGAIDLEALCVVAGQAVWNIQVDVSVLDHDGNLHDACSLAAMAALQHYRQPAVDASGSGMPRLRDPDEAEPSPLPLHHVPWSVTFVLLGAPTPDLVLDPCLAEEAVASGCLTIALNAHGEVCNLHFPGGCAVAPDLLTEAAEAAARRAKALQKSVAEALEAADRADEELRTAEIRRRNRGPGGVSEGVEAAGEDPKALELSHLGYNDLHVTGTLGKEREVSEKEKRGMEALIDSLERAADLTEHGAAGRRPALRAPKAPAGAGIGEKGPAETVDIAGVADSDDEEEEVVMLDGTM